MVGTKSQTFHKLDVIFGEKVTLRRLSMRDTEELYDEIMQQGVLEQLTMEINSPEDFKKYIMFIRRQWQLNNDFCYTIYHNDQAIGQTSLYNLSFKHLRAEIGIWMGPTHWRNGFGHEAISLLLRHSYNNLHLNRIYAHIFKENQGSISIFEKLGFSREGLNKDYVQKDDDFIDVYTYALLKREWENQI